MRRRAPSEPATSRLLSLTLSSGSTSLEVRSSRIDVGTAGVYIYNAKYNVGGNGRWGKNDQKGGGKGEDCTNNGVKCPKIASFWV